MRVARAVLEYLKAHDIDYIFGVPAGTVSPIYDAMNDVDICPIVAKNEGGAAYMAARYASISGKMGVCFGAGGVGANNMINGIADAMRAKAPMLIITGYVHRWQIGKGAIQELDTQNILKPITKLSKTLMDESKIMEELENAMRIAYTIPRGPVHLSIPIDIQLTECVEHMPELVKVETKEELFDFEQLQEASAMISSIEKGLIMVGKGCRGMSQEVMKLSEHLQWPIVTTPEGKGVVSSDFSLNLGTYGYASTNAAEDYVNDESVTGLLVLGSTLGETATSNFSNALFSNRKTIHVDWDKKELGKVYDTDIKICEDIHNVISYLLDHTEPNDNQIQIPQKRNRDEESNHTGLGLKEFMEKLPEVMPKNTYYVSDLGEFMNFIFKYLSIPEGGDFEINLNYAAMGSGIAGVIGTQMAHKDRPVAVFAGDGDFFMNGNEILTAKEYGLPIIYFIINNAMLGFVEHGHEFLFHRVVEGFKQERINIADMMKSCGIQSMQLTSIDDMEKIKEFIANPNGPMVIELITDGSEKAPNGDRLKSLQKHN